MSNNVIPISRAKNYKQPVRHKLNNQSLYGRMDGVEPTASTAHDMGPSRLNHGNLQCRKCLATDLEIQFALGPICPGQNP